MFSREEVLDYHSKKRPGKIELGITKPCKTQKDLSMAYTPGVAEPCREIEKNPTAVYDYTAKSNLVAVVTNGTAVLGLGNIGALASKPVMEGKGVLFKKFADIDVFDLEIDTQDPDLFIQTVRLMEPTFGGINLEDIKAPECFYIEQTLKKEMNIPVFHDDQHGTAIISGAGLLNAVEIVNKNISKIKVVCNGAGASAIACMKHYISLGVKKENIFICDSKGLIYKGRSEGMNEYKEMFAQDTGLRTLGEVIRDADLFIGLSTKDIVTEEMLLSMADNPIVFAMANPDPEITYEKAINTRKDVLIATGRSDYPNQINNVLGFPFIFRGALDVYSSEITEEMKIAASRELASIAKMEVPEYVMEAYNLKKLSFGKDYIIPKPFDRRVLTNVSYAVAKSAIDCGVSKVKSIDEEEYKNNLLNRIIERVGM